MLREQGGGGGLSIMKTILRKTINTYISSSKSISTEDNWFVMVLNSFRCWATAVAIPGIFLKVFLCGLALLPFFFFRFSVTIFSFLDFSSFFFFFFFFFAWKKCYEYYFGPCFGLSSETEYFGTDLFWRTVLGCFRVSKKN